MTKNFRVITLTHITLVMLLIGVFLFVLLNLRSNSTPNCTTDAADLAQAVNIRLPDGNNSQIQIDHTSDTVRPRLGAQLSILTATIRKNLHYAEQYGVYVQDTVRNSPAQTAGILPGDIIFKINNQDAQDLMPTLNLIAELNPGATYPIHVFRQGKELVYQVTPELIPPALQPNATAHSNTAPIVTPHHLAHAIGP